MLVPADGDEVVVAVAVQVDGQNAEVGFVAAVDLLLGEAARAVVKPGLDREVGAFVFGGQNIQVAVAVEVRQVEVVHRVLGDYPLADEAGVGPKKYPEVGVRLQAGVAFFGYDHVRPPIAVQVAGFDAVGSEAGGADGVARPVRPDLPRVFEPHHYGGHLGVLARHAVAGHQVEIAVAVHISRGEALVAGALTDQHRRPGRFHRSIQHVQPALAGVDHLLVADAG